MFRHPLISFVVFCNLMRSNNNKKLFDDKILFVLIYYLTFIHHKFHW